MTRARLVAFDLGGVVVDVIKDHLVAFGDAFYGGGVHDDVSTGVLDGDAYVAAVAAAAGRDADVVGDAWRRVVRWSPGGRTLVDDVKARAAVRYWSNTDPVHWQALGLDDDRCTSFRVGAMKPDAAYFARVVEFARVDGYAPDDIVYVDDRADNVAAARAFGVDATVVDGVAEARAAIFARLR